MKRRVPAKYLFSPETIAYSNAMRESLLDTIGKIKHQRVGILLSSGVDSHSCLAALLASGKKPSIYTATINNIRSRDYRGAEATAKKYNLPFTGININLTERYIKRYLRFVIDGILPDLHKNKTAIETHFMVFELISRVQEKILVTGFYGDAYFANLRSLKKIYDEGNYPWVLTNLRSLNPCDPEKCSDIQQMMRYAFIKKKKLNLDLCTPYGEDSFIDAATGMDPIVHGCKPIQKAPLRYAFYDYFEDNAENVRVNIPMQKGELRVDKVFNDILINSDWNTRGLKSAKGIYNDLERGLL